MIDLKQLTIKKLADMYRSKEATVSDVVDAYLAEIEKKNPELNAYLEIYDDVKAQAEEAQKRIDAGESGELIGIPVAVKDNILIKGKRVGSASKILENYVGSYDAFVIEKLKKEGVVFLGRTNMDEFAMGGSTENSAYGVTKNPHDVARVAGGSSGGSAVAVGGDLALAALGSDTGGSIRQPASFCNAVGLKPTYGSVSRSGLMAMGSSLDVIGPIAKTVTDTELLFTAIKGKDSLDSTSHDGAWSEKRESKKVIGVPRDFTNIEGIDPDVKENFEQSLEKMKSLGYEIRDVSMPTMPLSLAVYYILMPAEVSSNLSRFDGVKYGLHVDGKDLIEDYFKTRGEGFGKEARRRILVGTYVLSSGYYDAYYRKAVMVRNKIKKEFEAVFKEVDAIALPTSPTPAFNIGEKSDPLSLYLADIFTVSANIAGVPGISLPAGFVEREGKELPVGFQLLGSHNREDILFACGKDFLGE
ncbi:MAG: Asp-tRNA(Asn)/Glu-tRNA(Gln) amidotransferase GatCAB subunit A [Candidatus Zambryskibacteria bacterium CG10_big_fil_rev_8_21_14_0_10_42_12]|uniref:Glutamyl-tRNA(Gln) amidotransferase subunit A n=1 Tax=Candidatus Zambryskibacteria bacterium CG10_big_fil_rev_8_21_14_0_10_42_12 TaxID=1975115 RepID=A0A2H0QX46_9BACT|nr:MAG: Asp-tRNA(Asn)/Glu-tRNA(Gln) amidotransferase GatCAB subunit A [Candidatus Zambryskibacteria bacterium CG10_big_fil_rev_8_21_14_0_10_42_12]